MAGLDPATQLARVRAPMTRFRHPAKLEKHLLYADAIQREIRIKRWKREWKIALIEKTNPDWIDLPEKWNH